MALTLVVLAIVFATANGAAAVVLDFETLPVGKIVANSDLPVGYTLSVNNRTNGHPDKGIVFDSACPPGTVGTDCSGQDPDLMTPGPDGGVGNDRAQGKVLIIAEDVVDGSPADGLVDDPDDEGNGGTLTFMLPDGCALRSLRIIDIDWNEESTKVILHLPSGDTIDIPSLALGNNSAQTIEVPQPAPDLDGFTVCCDGSCAIDDIIIDCGVTTTTTFTSTPSSTTTMTVPPARCGDGVIDPGEQCDSPPVPNGEDCANQLDDDGDGLVDCADMADCPVNQLTCSSDCTLVSCTAVQRDPALIRFNRRNSGTDMFSIHGRFLADPNLELANDRFAVILSNENGIVYQGTLVPGELKRKIGGKGRYVFRDRASRDGGPGDSDGIYHVGMRVDVGDETRHVHFRLLAFGDFSAATVPLMTTQIAAGNYVGTLTAEWRRTGHGWSLKQRDFGEVD